MGHCGPGGDRECPGAAGDVGAAGLARSSFPSLQSAFPDSRPLPEPVRPRPWSRAVKKNADLSHRKRGKTARHRAKLKAKHQRVRRRKSSGHRSTYR